MAGLGRNPIPTASPQIKISKLVERLLQIRERRGDIGVMAQQFWDGELIFVKIDDVRVESSERNGLIAVIF